MEFLNLDAFAAFLEKKANSIGKAIAREAQKEFEKKIAELNNAFLSSRDFRDIKGKLQGEYGFTNEEVAGLDNIVDAMERSSKVTKDDTSFIIEYVNLKDLYGQPEASHSLSNAKGPGETISWAQWLEEGASIVGYSFDSRNSKSSRSGKGVMEEGGAWRLRPTRAFSKIAKNLDLGDLRNMMTLVVKRVSKKV